MQQRLSKVKAWLREQKVDFAFVNSSTNVFYLLGFKCDPQERLLGLCLFPDADPILICPDMESQQARNTGWSFSIVTYNESEDPWEKLKQNLYGKDIKNVQTIAIEQEQLTYSRLILVQSMYPNAQLTSFEACANMLRLVKDEQELAMLRKAGELADFGVKVGVNALAERQTEYEIIAEMEFELTKKVLQLTPSLQWYCLAKNLLFLTENPETASLNPGILCSSILMLFIKDIVQILPEPWRIKV